MTPLYADVSDAVFGRRFLFVAGDPKVCGQFLREYLPLADDFPTPLSEDEVVGSTGFQNSLTHLELHSKVILFWRREMSLEQPTARQLAGFFHEVYHAVCNALSDVGVFAGDGSRNTSIEETYAYYIGWLAEEVLDSVKPIRLRRRKNTTKTVDK